ncbi:up-regulator of cell proliferation-like [Rhinoderma darwinii]|uniref:up-regulator of cell proliferation-like n=1 Tax=Rhinoderma darwinii TaxID=43563 RepID=UPI003F67EADB
MHQVSKEPYGEFLFTLRFLCSFYSPQRLSVKPQHRKETLEDTMKLLGLEKYTTSKLTVSDILEIGPATVKEIRCKTVKDIPWVFLQNIMALNPSARNTSLEESENQDTVQVPIHALDVVCAILHCSDSFLQQDVMTKMSKCQFAVPLLLPVGDGKTFTFLLWALRDIVKQWKPQALPEDRDFREDNLVDISLPVFSFVRLGDCSLSKSKVLNGVLNHGQTHYDFFVNQEMECGNVQKTLSRGLVEISWFFPGASNSFPEPFAVTNLHGDIANNMKQFNFLTRVSSAVFIFLNDLTDENFTFLSECQSRDVTFYLITKKQVDNHIEDMIKQLQNFSITNGRNMAALIRNLLKNIATFLKNRPHRISLLDMSSTASDLDIEVDECNVTCQYTKGHALSITREIKDIVEYKNKTLKLQGKLWKELSKTEKEMCRMKEQGRMKSLEYKEKLAKQCMEIQEKQYHSEVPSDVHKFINVITKSSVVERRYSI